MNKTVIILITLLLSAAGDTFSQIPLNLKVRHRTDGDTITLTSALRSRGLLTVQTTPDPVTGKSVSIFLNDLKYYEMIPENPESLWQMILLRSSVYDKLLKSGYSYETRSAMEDMMKEYLSRAEQNNSFYIDSYLEARLYAILRKVYPVRHTDRRPGIVSLRIVSEIAPDAWVGPDGTLVITTGMIAALDNKTEMMALMAQEVAHFALDHHLSNYSAALALEINPALGNLIRNTRQQEMEADNCATSVLSYYGKSFSFLGSMLRNVIDYGELMGSFYLGSFPDAKSRADKYKDAIIDKSADYDKLVAPVISYNAFMAYSQSHYLLCRRLLERNIASGSATADDIVLLSQAMMNLSGSDHEDLEALALVRSVTESLQEAPPGAFRQEALLLMRLGRRGETETALDRYQEALEREEMKYSSRPGDWSEVLSYLASEKEWVARTRTR
ncbi:MAG TPA: M48 family metalloprotease [Bacteroidales bacterium]|nr:M48 family metalloprotease [Bacteroidales bacterium]